MQRLTGRHDYAVGWVAKDLLEPRHPRGDCRRNGRSEEHTSELQSQSNLVCRLLLEKKTSSPLECSTPHRSAYPFPILRFYSITLISCEATRSACRGCPSRLPACTTSTAMGTRALPI